MDSLMQFVPMAIVICAVFAIRTLNIKKAVGLLMLAAFVQGFSMAIPGAHSPWAMVFSGGLSGDDLLKCLIGGLIWSGALLVVGVVLLKDLIDKRVPPESRGHSEINAHISDKEHT